MSVDWVSIAVLSTAVLGLVNIIDSHLITKRMPSLPAFLLPAGFLILFFALVLSYLFPLSGGVSSQPMIVAVVSGLLRAGSLVILLYVLKTEEVSRAIPVFHIFPVFVAIMALPLLGETLGYLQWLAIVIVVAGAVLLSVKWGRDGSTSWPGRTFLLLLAASLLMAGANIASKYALGYVSFWNMYWISALCMSAVFMLISLRRHVFRELATMGRRGSALGLLAFNELLVLIGVLLMFWAMENGPVSLVSTIAGGRPLFVLIYAVTLSRFLPRFLVWQYGREALALRIIATTLIVSGIAVIYLT